MTTRRLLRLAEVPARRVALSVLLGSLAVLFGVGLMTAAGYLISRAAERPPILALTTVTVAVRFFGIGRPLVRYIDRLVSHDLALRALGRARSRVIERIEPLAPAGLEGYRRGDLLTRMVGDVDALQGLYVRGLCPPLVAMAVSSVCIGAVAAVSTNAALALATGLFLAGVGVPLLAAELARVSGHRQAGARAALTADLVELLRGAPELVAYGREAETLAAIGAADAELVRIGRRDALAGGVADGLLVLVTGLTTAAVLAVAVAAHDGGSLDRVLIAVLALLALSSFEAVAPLSVAARESSAIAASGRRVLALVDRRSVVEDPPDPVEGLSGPVAVALEGVTARYATSDVAVLEDFDLRLEPGERVALVGPSGAGKSTVASLLLRFLDPEAGRVTIGGHDLRDLRQEDVRRTFALAGQDAHLFDSSIRENLRLARSEASDEDLEKVLRRARIHDWVATLPDGIDTLVGEDGLELSGGQRQRLVLARALLSDAPVLILDEPTAHLDPATARDFMHDVFAAGEDRSVLLITHRPEGLDQVDAIVELSQSNSY